MKRAISIAVAVAALLTASCDNSTGSSGPGPLSAVLVSPNGNEGAAVLDVVGSVESVTTPDGVAAYTTPAANGLRIVLVRLDAGPLSMTLKVPDISNPPALSVVEVAGPDNALRQSLAGYRVEIQ
jgi:hypothetical protein